MDEYLGGDDKSSRCAMWEAFQTEIGNVNSTPFRSIIDHGQTKGKYVIEESESIIKCLESIYSSFSQIINLENQTSDRRKRDMIESLIWKLDLVMEGMLGITRVTSSSAQNISQAIFYSRREMMNLNKHKDGGYFMTLRNCESGIKLGKRRSSDISFEEAIKMFASNEIIHNHQNENEKQYLSSNKIDLSDDRKIDNGGHLSSNTKLPLNNDNDNNMFQESNNCNLMKIKKMKNNSTQYDLKYFSSFFQVSNVVSIQST